MESVKTILNCDKGVLQVHIIRFEKDAHWVSFFLSIYKVVFKTSNKGKINFRKIF